MPQKSRFTAAFSFCAFADTHLLKERAGRLPGCGASATEFEHRA
jgi:hypothetical protein